MDKHGIYAQGLEWEKAKQEAFSAKPSSLDEAQEVVIGVTRFYGSIATLVAVQDFFLLSTVIFPFSLRLMEQTRKAKNGDKRIRERISGCN